MFIKNVISSAALICIAVSATASAQHISPTNTTATFSGPASLQQGTVNLACTLDIAVTSGADIGGAHSNHATGGTLGLGTNFTSPAPCPAIVVRGDLTDFVITSYTPGGGAAGLGSGTGVINGLESV